MDEIDEFPMSDSEVEDNSDIDEEGLAPKKIKNKTTKKTIDNELVSDDEDDVSNSDMEDEDDDDEDDDDFEQFDDINDDNMENVLQNARGDKSTFSELDDFSDEESDEEDYLQKIDDGVKNNIVSEFHPELLSHNHDEVESMCVISRDQDGLIVDPLHVTLPFLTKYEKARIIGERAKQIDAGSQPFVEVDTNILDGYLIALKELDEKKLPFIIKRPLPNGGCEYWKLQDLEIIT
jgi:DNA-directed RNA polymerase I, II, and III subunit RPABC2